MATSPRPGVIQLNHPNVYMAAKEAQKDDWLRRGINLTGDIAGEALQKRNQDIRYRRAAGLDEDRRTNGEIAADLGSGVWGGLKALGSGIASVGESAWGLLKAPFADEAPMAPTVTEDYRTEVGEKKTSPLAETPTDIIDSPEQILNAHKITTEVDGLPSTQTAEPGVKVSFPMTVAGSVERSNLPDTVVPLPKKEEAPVQPQATLQAPKTPDWSEMFRLDPERAKYDWTRAHNTEVLAQKAEAAQARMELMQAKMEAKANAGSSLEELQQLWKENQRGLLQARKDLDNSSTKMYEGNIARLLPILQEKAPAVWGNPPGKGPGAKTPPPGDGEVAPKTPEQLRQDRRDAVKEGYAAVRTYMVDKDSNGVIDDPLALEYKLTEIRDKYGVSESDLADVRSAIEKVAKAMQENSQFNVGEGERRRSAAAQAFSQHKDFLPSVQTVKAIQADPSNQTNIQLGVSELLKILSGTGVSDSERMNTILSMTPTEYQNEIRSKSIQLGKSFIDKFLNMDAVSLAEYSTKVDPQLIAKELKKRIPSESWKWAEKHSMGGGDNKSAPGGKDTVDTKKYNRVDGKGKVTISGWK